MSIKKIVMEGFIYPLKIRIRSLFLERVPPHEYVGLFTIQNLNRFLNLDPNQLRRCCIVGTKYGFEIDPILTRYPEIVIDAFECSPRWLHHLQIFKNNPRVNVIPKAVSSVCGISSFFETNLEGNGSLLKIGKLHREWYDSKQTEEYLVATITLDNYYEGTLVDLLWIDVQGAEKLVLLGAEKVLKTAKAVFIEVTQSPDFYEGSSTFEEISEILKVSGFRLALLGMEFKLTGNALFVRYEQGRDGS